MRLRTALPIVVVLLGSTLAADQAVQQPASQRRVFRGGVARVSVAATVRDGRGRPVTDLTASDFDLFDNGQRREIVDFSRDEAPVGIGLLVDVSGSMDVAAKRAAALETSRLLVQSLDKNDRVGLFAFDRLLAELAPVGTTPDEVLRRLARIDSYGRTSVFDAIADTARKLSETGGPRRAVIVLTDGDDNASKLDPAYVSSVASGIDVPVYVFVVVSPLDRAGGKTTVIDEHLAKLQQGSLGNLARWTGGEILVPVRPEDAAAMTKQVVTELRHQYLMAFEPGGQSGWHPLEVRARRPNLTVRARSGYIVPAATGESVGK
ncbi:MAG TPA: VWA domain-containing protein [Vicinamibacterales bacterium]|nr:VWA domain-containing protein [Vicinamibacterales bacterium]